MRKYICFFIGVFLLSASVTLKASANIIYEEDFSSDPNFTPIYTPTGTEYFTWDNINEIYKVRINDGWNVNKFTISPQFPKVQDASFTFSIDMNRQYISFGQGVGVRLFDSDVGYSRHSDSLRIHQKGFTGDPYPSQRIIIGDSFGNDYFSPRTSPNTWYRVTIIYNALSKTADIEIIERDTGALFYQEVDVPLNVLPFNQVGFGDYCIWDEGTYAILHFDNILIQSDQTSLTGLTELIETLVEDGAIDEEIENSLISKVINAQKSAEKGNIDAAINQLEALRNQVNAQRGKKISEEAADLIVAYIDNLIAQLFASVSFEELQSFIDEKGFHEEIQEIENWAEDNSQISLDFAELLNQGLIAGGFLALEEGGLKQILGIPLKAWEHMVGVLGFLIDMHQLTISIDHTLSDFESAIATENNKTYEMFAALTNYYDSPSGSLRKEILDYVEDGAYGIYRNTYLQWTPLPEKNVEEIKGITWEQVFTYRLKEKEGPYMRAEGWFGNGKEIEKFYAIMIKEVIIQEAKDSLEDANKLMLEYILNPEDKDSYKNAWLQVMETADYIRMAYIFKSMIYTQRTGPSGRKRLCFEEREDAVVLTYPYYKGLEKTRGYFISGSDPAGNLIWDEGTWEDTRLDINEIKMAIFEAEKEKYWHETSLEIFEDYLLK